MLLDLKPLFAGSKEFIPVDYSMDLSEVDFYGIKPMKKPIAISGQIVSRAGIVEAGLTCSVEYTAPCDRCGEETKKTYSFKIVRTIVFELENEDTDEMTVVPDMKLDLEEFCYADIIMSLPTKHLCKEDCKGLCPSCGTNFNLGRCDCKTDEETVGGLSALAELLKD